MERKMDVEVRMLEELSLNAHPAIDTIVYDGWVLRFAKGYTSRANSVNMLYPSQMPLANKIDFCESIYLKQNLPTIFKVTPLSNNIDDILAKRGYVVLMPTNIMTKDIAQKPFPTVAHSVVAAEGISEDWQNNYFRLNQTKIADVSVAKQIQGKIINRVLTATIADENGVVACGLGVIERDYVGLYDIIVSPQFRRKGYGHDICTSLLNKAGEFGVNRAYLQVVADNTSAIELYQKMGFADVYTYWYRVKNIS